MMLEQKLITAREESVAKSHVYERAVAIRTRHATPHACASARPAERFFLRASAYIWQPSSASRREHRMYTE